MGAGLRLFFALCPDDAVRTALAQRTGAAHAALGGRPVAASALHLTLVFLGEVAAQRVAALDQVARALPWTAFDLCLDRAGLWSREGIAWVAPQSPAPGLARLQRDLEQALCGIGLEPPARDFRPHVTLLRRAGTGSMPAFAPLLWPVRAFALLASELEPSGPRYTCLGSYRASLPGGCQHID